MDDHIGIDHDPFSGIADSPLIHFCHGHSPNYENDETKQQSRCDAGRRGGNDPSRVAGVHCMVLDAVGADPIVVDVAADDDGHNHDDRALLHLGVLVLGNHHRDVTRNRSRLCSGDRSAQERHSGPDRQIVDADASEKNPDGLRSYQYAAALGAGQD